MSEFLVGSPKTQRAFRRKNSNSDLLPKTTETPQKVEVSSSRRTRSSENFYGNIDNPDEYPGVELKHSIFVGGTGDLSEDQLFKHFNETSEVVGISVIPERGFCVVTFRKVGVAKDLVDKRFDWIGQRRVELKYYKLETSKSESWYGKQQIKEEQRLDEVEGMLAQDVTFGLLPKTLKIIDDNSKSPLPPGAEYTWDIVIRNLGLDDCKLISIEPITSRSEFTVLENFKKKKNNNLDGGIVIGSGETHAVTIRFHAKHDQAGVFRQSILFQFKECFIFHTTSITIQPGADLKSLEVQSPAAQIADTPHKQDVELTSSGSSMRRSKIRHRIHTAAEVSWVEPLSEYAIPEDFQEGEVAFSSLSRSNIHGVFHQKLWNEEIRLKKAIRKFSIREVTLEPIPIRKISSQSIPNNSKSIITNLCRVFLSEKPPVDFNDFVYLWPTESQDLEFEAVVVKLEPESIILSLCDGFSDHHTPVSKYNVRFTVNRKNWRILHRAVEVVPLSVIWPVPVTLPLITQNIEIPSLQNPITDNVEHKQVILNVLYGCSQKPSAPILIIGPFRSGKTTVVMESVRYLLNMKGKEPRIVIATATEGDADQYVMKLGAFYSSKELLRLQTHLRRIDTASNKILPYTYHNKEREVFEMPNSEILRSYKIIVSTALNCGSLYGMGITGRHFTHIIVDDAQAVDETEALIPLSLGGDNTHVILTGDVCSAATMQETRENRIVRRLLTLDIYKSRPELVGQLTKNYDTHPKIVEFLAKPCYGGQLHPIDPSISVAPSPRALLNWSKVPNRDFSFLFFGVEGEETREIDAEPTTTYNAAESSMLAELLTHIFEEQQLEVEDIGIICTYPQQVRRLKTVMKQKGLSDLQVGAPQDFTSKYKRVVFVSTVRTKNHPGELVLGDLSHPMILNSVFSRALSLVVVVGHPAAVSSDPLWKEFLEFCMANRSYVGPHFGSNLHINIPPSSSDLEVASAPLTSPRHSPRNSPRDLNSPRNSPRDVNSPRQAKRNSSFGKSNNTRLRAASQEGKHQLATENPVAAPTSPVPPYPTQYFPQQFPYAPPQQQYPYAPPQWLSSGQFPMTMSPGTPPYPGPIPEPFSPQAHPQLAIEPQEESPFVCVFTHEGNQMIFFHSETGCPPLVVYDRPDCLEIKVSIFDLKPIVDIQGHEITITLEEQEPTQETLFRVGCLQSGSSKVHTSSKLLILIPTQLFDVRTIDISISRTMLLVTVPRRVVVQVLNQPF